MVRVQQLNVYPLKSARGIELARARVLASGIEWDRHWMTVDANGKFLSQRTHPRLARIGTALEDGALLLSSEGRDSLAVPLAASGEPVPLQVWKDPCEGLEQSEEASAWCSAVLGEPVRLVRTSRQLTRAANPDFAGTGVPVSFVDGFPILVCNAASLEELNARLPEPIPMERFRPNLVLQGLPSFAEDRISELEIGDLRLRLVKPCTRCVIPSLDQRTGAPSTDPTPALRAFRFDRSLLGVTFGENAVPSAGMGTVLERGMAVRVAYEG